MPRRCYGEHKLFAPIRPIALTLCDVYSLARANRQLAVGLAVIAGLLVFAAYKLAMTFESSAAELIYRAIQAYLSKKATGMFTQGALHLLFSNLTFAAFRLCAYLALRAAYDLGRDVVFALSLLVFATLLAAVFPTALVGERWMGVEPAARGHRLRARRLHRLVLGSLHRREQPPVTDRSTSTSARPS